MSGGKPAPLVVNGWTIYAHPLFLNQVEALIQQVEGLKRNTAGDPVVQSSLLMEHFRDHP